MTTETTLDSGNTISDLNDPSNNQNESTIDSTGEHATQESSTEQTDSNSGDTTEEQNSGSQSSDSHSSDSSESSSDHSSENNSDDEEGSFDQQEQSAQDPKTVELLTELNGNDPTVDMHEVAWHQWSLIQRGKVKEARQITTAIIYKVPRDRKNGEGTYKILNGYLLNIEGNQDQTGVYLDALMEIEANGVTTVDEKFFLGDALRITRELCTRVFKSPAWYLEQSEQVDKITELYLAWIRSYLICKNSQRYFFGKKKEQYRDKQGKTRRFFCPSEFEGDAQKQREHLEKIPKEDLQRQMFHIKKVLEINDTDPSRLSEEEERLYGLNVNHALELCAFAELVKECIDKKTTVRKIVKTELTPEVRENIKKIMVSSSLKQQNGTEKKGYETQTSKKPSTSVVSPKKPVVQPIQKVVTEKKPLYQPEIEDLIQQIKSCGGEIRKNEISNLSIAHMFDFWKKIKAIVPIDEKNKQQLIAVKNTLGTTIRQEVTLLLPLLKAHGVLDEKNYFEEDVIKWELAQLKIKIDALFPSLNLKEQRFLVDVVLPKVEELIEEQQTSSVVEIDEDDIFGVKNQNASEPSKPISQEDSHKKKLEEMEAEIEREEKRQKEAAELEAAKRKIANEKAAEEDKKAELDRAKRYAKELKEFGDAIENLRLKTKVTATDFLPKENENAQTHEVRIEGLYKAGDVKLIDLERFVNEIEGLTVERQQLKQAIEVCVKIGKKLLDKHNKSNQSKLSKLLKHWGLIH